MKSIRRLLPALIGGALFIALGVLAQDVPAVNQSPTPKRMRQGMGMGPGMEHHEEIANAVTQVRESLAALQQETDMAKIKAGLAENEALLEKVEGLMASRRTMMQLRMAKPESAQ